MCKHLHWDHWMDKNRILFDLSLGIWIWQPILNQFYFYERLIVWGTYLNERHKCYECEEGTNFDLLM